MLRDFPCIIMKAPRTSGRFCACVRPGADAAEAGFWEEEWILERIRLAVFILGMFLAVCPAASAAERPAAGQALVVLRNGLAEPLTEEALASVEGRIYVAEVAHSVGARVEKVYESLSVAGGTIFALFASERQTTEQLVEALKQCPEVLAASPNREIRTMRRPGVNGTVSADLSQKAPAAKP